MNMPFKEITMIIGAANIWFAIGTPPESVFIRIMLIAALIGFAHAAGQKYGEEAMEAHMKRKYKIAN